jgi:hypothetical protein
MDADEAATKLKSTSSSRLPVFKRALNWAHDNPSTTSLVLIGLPAGAGAIAVVQSKDASSIVQKALHSKALPIVVAGIVLPTLALRVLMASRGKFDEPAEEPEQQS